MSFRLIKELTCLRVEFGKRGEGVTFDFENKLALISIDGNMEPVPFDDLIFKVITSPVVLSHSSKRINSKSSSGRKKTLNEQTGAWGARFKVRLLRQDEDIEVGSVNSALVSKLIADAFISYVPVDEMKSIVEFSSEVSNAKV
ncbi:hypothetical protein VCHA53O466_50074 [Vibrio chagasii]|nr:hypothetical protein VCHA53O466_50074 [Vibrio chagasii]